MLENDLRTLFSLETDGEQPPSRISLPAASRSARTRRRRRRTVAIGSPVLVAAAVIGIVAGSTLLGAGHAPGNSAPGPSVPSHAVAPASPASGGPYLDPLLVYASFGWLPAGEGVVNGGTGLTGMFLNAATKNISENWSLLAYPAGQCRLQRNAAHPSRSELSGYCTVATEGGQPMLLTGSAPDVRGHRAYWAASGYLAWCYAPDSWAMLQYPFTHHGSPASPQRAPKSALAVKVADHVKFGRAEPIEFPAQLTGVPANWQVSSVNFPPQTATPLTSKDQLQYELTAGAEVLAPGSGGYPTNMPIITISGAGNSSNTTCSFSGGRPASKVINGYRVKTARVPAIGSSPREQQLCAADADGLYVFINEIGNRPAMSAVSVFAHLRLLGTSPADWTTQPIAG
jgi:hypothetical protein